MLKVLAGIDCYKFDNSLVENNTINWMKKKRSNFINLKRRWEFFSKLLKVRHEPHKSYVAMRFWKKCKWTALSLFLSLSSMPSDDRWLEKEANLLPIMQLAFVCNVDDEKMNSKNADLYHVYVIRSSFTYFFNFFWDCFSKFATKNYFSYFTIKVVILLR